MKKWRSVGRIQGQNINIFIQAKLMLNDTVHNSIILTVQ